MRHARETTLLYAIVGQMLGSAGRSEQIGMTLGALMPAAAACPRASAACHPQRSCVEDQAQVKKGRLHRRPQRSRKSEELCR